MALTQHYDLDSDTLLGGASASDLIIPSQKAIKTYVDNNSGVTGANTDLSNLTATGEAHFQAPLVSGTNIKTINNTSLLGSGNIDTANVYWATYGTTTYADMLSAINDGKLVLCKYSGSTYYYDGSGGGFISFTTNTIGTNYIITVDSSDNWTNESRVIPTVDQTYDSTSANAQSGVAIAGELTKYAKTSDIPTSISDLTDDTSTTPIDKADTLTGLTATITELNYVDGVTSAIQTQLNGKQSSSTAVTHTASTAVGSGTQPVYIASDGTATTTTYALNKTVPADAVFTDTTYSTFTGATGSIAGTAGLVIAPTATDNTKFLKGDGTWSNSTTWTYNSSTENLVIS